MPPRRRAKFTAAPDVTQRVVGMVVPPTRRIAERLADHARDLAPPTKVWITVETGRGPCEHCRPLNGVEIPDNLRFGGKSFAWDMGIGRELPPRGAPVIGPVTYLLFPRDETSRGVVFVKHCQCVFRSVADGISKTISTEEPLILADQVRVDVVSEGNYVVASEFGMVYPDGQESLGARYMGGAVDLTAAELGPSRR